LPELKLDALSIGQSLRQNGYAKISLDNLPLSEQAQVRLQEALLDEPAITDEARGFARSMLVMSGKLRSEAYRSLAQELDGSDMRKWLKPLVRGEMRLWDLISNVYAPGQSLGRHVDGSEVNPIELSIILQSPTALPSFELYRRKGSERIHIQPHECLLLSGQVPHRSLPCDEPRRSLVLGYGFTGPMNCGPGRVA
jgi:hypothetical protein